MPKIQPGQHRPEPHKPTDEESSRTTYEHIAAKTGVLDTTSENAKRARKGTEVIHDQIKDEAEQLKQGQQNILKRISNLPRNQQGVVYLAVAGAFALSGFVAYHVLRNPTEALNKPENKTYTEVTIPPKPAMPTYEQLYASLEQQTAAHEYLKAINTADQILSTRPDNIPTLRLQARAQYALGNNTKAIHTYERLIQLNPKDHESYAGKARTLESEGKLEEALNMYKWADQLDGPETQYKPSIQSLEARLK